MYYTFDITDEQPQNKINIMIITKDLWKIKKTVNGIIHFYGISVENENINKIIEELINNRNVCIKCNEFHIRIDLGDTELIKNHGVRRNMVFCDKELAYEDFKNNKKYEAFEDSIEPIVTINGLCWISNYIPSVFII